MTSGIRLERDRVRTTGAKRSVIIKFQIGACVAHSALRHQRSSNQTYRGRNFLNNGIIHLSPNNGAVCLHDDIIILSQYLFVGRTDATMKKLLRSKCVVSGKLKTLMEGCDMNHFNLVNGRQVVPGCFNFFDMLHVAFKTQTMSDSINFISGGFQVTH